MAVIAISAGEASGDLYGAELAKRLRERAPDVRFIGCGASKMRAAGVEIVEDSSDWGVMSIAQALRIAPRVLLAARRLRRRLLEERPSLFIAVDFGALNVPLCRWAKATGMRTMYFMPPGAWRKGTQGRDLPVVADAIATPFEWSRDILRSMGARVEWVGHPLLDIVKPSTERNEFFRRLGLDDAAPVVGLFPGSRKHEVEHHLPAMAAAVGILRRRYQAVQAVAALAPNLDEASAQAHWDRGSPGNVIWTRDVNYDVIAHSNALAVSSGTATLEAAILGTPMVAMYKGSYSMYLEYCLRRKRIPFFSLPNIVLDEAVVPELAQKDVTPERIAAEVRPLLEEIPTRCRQIEKLRAVGERLGTPGAVDRTAEIALALITR